MASPEIAATTDTLAMSTMLTVVDDILREEGPSCNSCRSTDTLSLTYCIECHAHFCSFCYAQVHSRDPHTTHPGGAFPYSYGSSLLPFPPLPRRHHAPTFPAHPEEDVQWEEVCNKHSKELSHFCNSCFAVLCISCLVEEHKGHPHVTIAEAIHEMESSFSAFRSKLPDKLERLSASADATKEMSERVLMKKEEALVDVSRLFQSLRESVSAREKEVVSQINALADLRLESLARERREIEVTMDAVKTLAVKKTEEKSLLVLAYQRLKHFKPGYINEDVFPEPTEDSSFYIQSNLSPAQGALRSFCSLSTAPHPPLSVATGEGLTRPRINHPSTVVVQTKDRMGGACREGGERLFVTLSFGTVALPVDVRDNTDGTYTISYRPHNQGEHQLVIAIRGQHIQGSPFSLIVDGGREYTNLGIVSLAFGTEGSKPGQLSRPWGICSDQKGNIIVGDRSNHRIQVFDSGGAFVRSFGSNGNRKGQFNRPAGVATTREGHVVVADKDNHRIQVLTLEGVVVHVVGGTKGGNDDQMIYPYDVAVNQVDGRICVTDTGNHRILIFSPDCKLIGKFGYKGYLCGHFDSPRGIAFSNDGYIIVSDFNVHHILVIHPDGTTAHIFGSQGGGNGQFTRPQGIAIDHMGNFVIADTRNNRVVVMQPNGRFIAKFGSSGSGKGQFDRPTDVTVLPDGKIAVLDFGNSRVQIF